MTRGRREGSARVCAGLAAIALVGCASATPLPVVLPSDDERRAAEAAGFEVPPVESAHDLLAPELMEGPDYSVESPVYTDGTLRVYTVISDFGTFHARGDDMLQTRLDEVEALAAMKEMSATATFATAAAGALTSPFVATWNLVTHPVDTIVGIPKGAWDKLKRTSDLAQGDRGEHEDNAFVAFIGFETRKREIAGELGVDPYSSNKVLQRELNRFAWAAYAGGLPSLFVPFSELPAEEGAEEAGADERLQSILRSYSPEDLDRLNRIELAVMGVPKPLSDEFLHHRWYSPRHETAVVESLAALDLAEDRQVFIEAAVTADSEDGAHFYQQTAELMRRYNDNVDRIDRVAAVDGAVVGYTGDGVLVVPFAADHAVWSEPTAQFAESVTRSRAGDPDVRATVWVLSGTLSPKARTKLEGLGVGVTEHAFDQLPAGGPATPEADE